MTLLKFVHETASGPVNIGFLNWYAIHPTDRGQNNKKINSDNKGWAAYLSESANTSLVCGYANSNAGDVSGNLLTGVPDGTHDRANMAAHGQRQHDKAMQLFNNATEELSGSVDYRYKHVDMSNVSIEAVPGKRTWPAALGLAFAAGSTEDSKAVIVGDIDTGLDEGLPKDDLSVSETGMVGTSTTAMSASFGVQGGIFSTELKNGHGKKAIIYAPGLLNPSIVPQTLPYQLIRIGQLAIIAGPGEFTVMAGRRLNKTVLDELQGSGITKTVLFGFANEYTQYITTKEEYDMQHYEGGSTLFGPYTLMAYQQEYRKMATALKNGAPISWTPHLDPQTAPNAERVTIRNQSNSSKTLQFYKYDDILCAIQLDLSSGTTIPANSDYAFRLSDFGTTIFGGVSKFKARLPVTHWNFGEEATNGCKGTKLVNSGQMFKISPNSGLSVESYRYLIPVITI